MTYDKQDLLLDLRKLAADRPEWDTELDHIQADEALLRFIDDEHVTAAYSAVSKWYS